MEQQIELLKLVYEYLPKFNEGIKELAKKIKITVTPKERETIVEMIEGIQWLIEAFNLTRDIQVVLIDVQETKDLFSEMIETLENDDMILLGDLLEYELVPIIDKWEKQIKESLDSAI